MAQAKRTSQPEREPQTHRPQQEDLPATTQSWRDEMPLTADRHDDVQTGFDRLQLESSKASPAVHREQLQRTSYDQDQPDRSESSILEK